MKNGKTPDPNVIHPIAGYENEIYVKPTISNPNILVGDFTYIADADFERHVTHHYAWNGDRLIIGKFCQIAAGVEFVMNGANHQMNAVTTYPFYTLEGWSMDPPAPSDLPHKGDTVIGNDVWIGQNAVILPGVRIGDGAIIGASSVVGSDVAPYTVVAGNPARALRKRFDDELTDLLLRFRWWDKSVEEIDALIPILTSGDPEAVRAELRARLTGTRFENAIKSVQEDIQMFTTTMTPEKALAGFGLGCAQHVFGEFAPQFGIERETALKIAALFGSGMFEGASCGAVVGALMAIGLKYGQGDDPDPEKQEILQQKCAQFKARYAEKYGSCICREILGYKIPEELEKIEAENKFVTVCSRAISDACQICADILNEE